MRSTSILRKSYYFAGSVVTSRTAEEVLRKSTIIQPVLGTVIVIVCNFRLEKLCETFTVHKTRAYK